MINFFKKDKEQKKGNNEFLSKVASLLIHTAKIDEDYTNDEKQIIKKTLIKLGAENSKIFLLKRKPFEIGIRDQKM